VLLVSAAPNAVRSAVPDAVPDAAPDAASDVVPDAVSSAVPDAARAVPVRNDVELWRPFVDGPIHTLEVPCEHQQLMLPDSMARVGPAVSRLLAGGSRS
jgi:thioesterase domain-containing protein